MFNYTLIKFCLQFCEFGESFLHVHSSQLFHHLSHPSRLVKHLSRGLPPFSAAEKRFMQRS